MLMTLLEIHMLVSIAQQEVTIGNTAGNKLRRVQSKRNKKSNKGRNR